MVRVRPPSALRLTLFWPFPTPVRRRDPPARKRSRESFPSVAHRQSVTIRLVVLEHLPGNQRQFPRARHNGNVAVLFVRKAAELHTERAGVFVAVLRRLAEHPSGVTRPAFGAEPPGGERDGVTNVTGRRARRSGSD